MRRGRPGAQRAAVDVDDRRQRPVAGIGRRGDPGLDRAAGPGRSVRVMSGIGCRRCQAEPIVVRVRGRAAARCGSLARLDSSIARTPSVPSQLIAPAAGPRVATASEWVDDVARHDRLDPGRARRARRSGGTTVGWARPFRVTVATIAILRRPVRPAARRHHPARQVRVGPLADRQVQVRREVTHGGADPSPDPTMSPGLRSSSGSGTSRPDRHDPATVRRPGGVVGPAGRCQDLARFGPASSSTSTAQIVVRGRTSGIRPACGRERDRPSVRAPRDVGHAPVARGDLPRLGARRRVDDEQVRPAVQVADAVPAPVGPRDPSGEGRVVASRQGLLAPDRRHVADEEPGRIDLRGEGEARPIGRPLDLSDRPEAQSPGLWRTRPPAIGTRHRRVGSSSSSVSPRRNATYRASGEIRGQPSRTAPLVMARRADDATRDAEACSRPSGTTCRWL